MNLFENTKPLAERMRPQTLDNFYGNQILFEKYPFLQAMYQEKFYRSSIFYGPSGSGKTTFALLLVKTSNLPVFQLNAVNCNKKDLTDVIEKTKEQPVILLLDEIHRLSKDKQEILLPVIESGAVVLFGLTTVHPFSSLPASIRSRVSIYHFEEQTLETIEAALKRACNEDELLKHQQKNIDDDVFTYIAKIANGDIRYAMNTLEEIIISSSDNNITMESLAGLQQQIHAATDQTKLHYDLVSALQKSIRGSDADAALYWLLRLSENQDIMEIARRLLVIAYEDVALGYPAATDRVLNAVQTAEKIGFPEAIFPLAYSVIELALAPKSRTISTAIHHVQSLLETEGNLAVPEILQLRTIDRQHYYDYNNIKSWEKIVYLPEKLKNHSFLDFTKEYRGGKYEEQMKIQYHKLKNRNK
jgi:ATPase related to the helicase subunit of the Holliday junction resolvase